MNNLTHLSLFTGIGGIDLAAEWAGFESIGQVEFAEYPYKVLCKRWPDVPKWRDIRDVTSGSIREKYKGHITLISGGFPCQPFSIAGKRRGKEDDRFLWPEMLRIISEIRPDWVIGENVANFKNMGLGEALTSLENEGYTTQPYSIPACAINADHRRERIFIVAHNNKIGCNTGDIKKQIVEWKNPPRNKGNASDLTSYNGSKRIERSIFKPILWRPGFQGGKNGGGYKDEDIRRIVSSPTIRGNIDGIPNWMDRLECLGNSVVPYQVYPILKAIADIENGLIT